MSEPVHIGDATLYTGDVLAVLAGLPEESVHCVVTSSPYWGLRDYGIPPTVWDGEPGCTHEWQEHVKPAANGLTASEMQGDTLNPTSATRKPQRSAFCSRCGAWLGAHGLEPTPELYVQHEVQIFRAVHRVLRKDGTLWLNLGASYAGSGCGWGGGGLSETSGHHEKIFGTAEHVSKDQTPPPGFKPKDMIPIPWMVAMALQADGWYLRSACPWLKRNSMPESCTDRPATAVEYIFLFAKSAKYFYDNEAVKSEASKATHARISQDLAAQVGSYRANGGNKTNGPMKAVLAGTTRKIAEAGSGIAANRSLEAALALPVETRNRRNSDWFFESWQGLLSDEDGDPLAFIVNPQGYKGAHFATFPRKLVQPCILAGCPEHACPQCGAPWVREVERERAPRGDSFGKKDVGEFDHGQEGTPYMQVVGVTTIGEHPTCSCGLPPIGGTVLDPFGGSGTVGEVALEYGRRAILIELKPEYVELQKRRLAPVAGRPMLDFAGGTP